MILYSKELKKMFLIDINDYKKKCEKYKIVGKDGKGKEYIINTNILIFEIFKWKKKWKRKRI